MAEFIVKLKKRELKRVPITSLQTLIGRDATCGVMIDNPGVSRIHAKVCVEDERFVIYDAGSSNGMFINGDRMTKRVLRDGDEIQIGKFVVVFAADGAADMTALEDNRPVAQLAAAKARRDLIRTTHLSPNTMHKLILASELPTPGAPPPETAEPVTVVNGDIASRRLARRLGALSAGLAVAVLVLAAEAIWQIF